MSKSTNDSHIFFALVLTDSEILKCLIFLPSKRRARSWSTIIVMTPLVGNFKVYKRLPHFCTSSHNLSDINILNVWPSKSWSRSLNTIFNVTRLTANVKIYEWLSHFCASFNRFRVINILNFHHQKVVQSHGVNFFAIMLFDFYCYFLFFICANDCII